MYFLFTDMLPGTIFRVGRAPLSYGFGSGFSSNIGGLRQASAIGSSYNSDNVGQAYASGIGISDGGYAQGVGLASSGNAYPVYQAQPTYTVVRPTYNNARASAQNFGGSNLASSSANTNNGQAISYAQNLRGVGYPSVATSSASNDGFGNQKAISSTHTAGLGYNSHSVAAAERHGHVSGSSAQTVQQRGNTLQQSGASSINAPGFKSAHSHAVQTGFY